MVSIFDYLPLPNLSSLPFPALPSALQRKLLAFLLRKSIGSFIKGGLDADTIEADLAQGNVKVSSLELATEAFNPLLSSTPYLSFDSGTIGTISAQITWPLSLSSNLSIEVDEINIVLRLTAPTSNSPPPPHRFDSSDDHDLNASVISVAVASEFVKEALSKEEDEQLRESLHFAPADVQSSMEFIPGAFSVASDRNGAGNFEEVEEVTVLADLIERIMARVSFKMRKIKVRIICGTDDAVEVDINVEEVRYADETSSLVDKLSTPIRTLRFSSPTLHLRTPFPIHPTHSASSSTVGPGSLPASNSSSSSSSSSEEADISLDHDLMMSQSIADLRASSMSSASSASMYASAVAVTRTLSTLAENVTVEDDGSPFIDPESVEKDFNLASIELDMAERSEERVKNEALQIGRIGGSEENVVTLSSYRNVSTRVTTLSLAISIPGSITIALLPYQLQSIFHLCQIVLSSPSSQTSSSTAPPPASTPPGISMSIRSINLVQAYVNPTLISPAIPTSFWIHPKTSPFHLSHLRLSLETLNLRQAHNAAEKFINIASILLTESVALETHTRTFPLLVFDSNLLKQSQGIMPTFESYDWMQDESSEATGWKVKLPKPKKGSKLVIDAPAAISIHLEDHSTSVQLNGLHLFADLTAVSRITPFLSSLSLPSSPSSSKTPRTTKSSTLSTPRFSRTPRLANSTHNILDDLNFEPLMQQQKTELVVSFDIIRVELRCPPPVNEEVEPAMTSHVRSGILILDVLNAKVEENDEKVLAIRWNRLSFSLLPFQALRVSTFLSINPLAIDGGEGTRDIDPASLPSIVVQRVTSSVDLSTSRDSLVPATTAIDCQLPSIRTAVDKIVLDTLQLLADDLAQWNSRTFEAEIGLKDGTRNERMLGSRYFGARSFSRRRAESESEDSVAEGARSLTVKIAVTDVLVDLSVPSSSDLVSRHLRASLSDLKLEIELLRNSKNDLHVDATAMDMTFEDLSTASPRVVFSRTLPRNLTVRSLPLLDLHFTSSVEKESGIKESKIRLTLSNFVHYHISDLSWLQDLALYSKPPPGVFETAVPNELTRVRLHIIDGTIYACPPNLASRIVLSFARINLSTNIIPDLPRSQISMNLEGARALMIDDVAHLSTIGGIAEAESGLAHWMSQGFVQLLDVDQCTAKILQGNGLVLPDLEVHISDTTVELSLCADSMAVFSAMMEDISASKPDRSQDEYPLETTVVDIDEDFSANDDYNEAPEDLDDDVPVNLDYLADALGPISTSSDKKKRAPRGASYGTNRQRQIISDIDGETIQMLDSRGLRILDDYLVVPRVDYEEYNHSPSITRCRLSTCTIAIRLHSGYDWSSTRKALVVESKAVRRRLEKIRQLLAKGQQSDATADETSVLMFGSIQLGLQPGTSELKEDELLAAIDEQLLAPEVDIGDSSLPSNTPSATYTPDSTQETRGLSLARSKTFEIEINLRNVGGSFDTFPTTKQIASRTQVDIESFDIIDNIRTSTWKKFLTELRSSDGGVVRASETPMLRLEMKMIRGSASSSTTKSSSTKSSTDEEVVAKLKILPLRLYIDQDALDFLKAFGAFKYPSVGVTPSSKPEGPFFQRFEVLPVKIKMDYKPKRVNYDALRRGKTAELMNFFHFDGSEMTLRHLVVTGIAGSTRLSELVQDIWSPDVKSNQLADVISGIAPVRSVINVGSGMANLVLLPIEQYRKDGRLARGLQKGATAFARTTTLEALDVGARLATGTQVILERALSSSSASSSFGSSDAVDPMSRFAQQPMDIQQGIEGAYKSLGDNFRSAAQTILAIPLEVYERSGSEGPVRAVIRAVPIAVLKPMIGASEAVSKTLLGLRNSLDPQAQDEALDKYKSRP